MSGEMIKTERRFHSDLHRQDWTSPRTIPALLGPQVKEITGRGICGGQDTSNQAAKHYGGITLGMQLNMFKIQMSECLVHG